MVPVHHIFGSEELSAVSAAIAERVPNAYVAIGVGQAQTLSIEDGEEIEVSDSQTSYRLVLKVSQGLTDGVIGLPVGLPG